MAENNLAAAFADGNTHRFKEAVCIEAGRIYDSCSDKDCLEDLQVFFSSEGQQVIDASTSLKFKSAEVMDVYLTVEPIPFNRGFFTVDITFYFRVGFSAYASPGSTPVEVTGMTYHCKKVILFGSEGNIKTFSSVRTESDCCVSDLPVATLKVAQPIMLGCRIVETAPCFCEPVGIVPADISDCFEGDLVDPGDSSKIALVTLGVFTIVTLQRDMQMMVPAYDYCVPDKDCMTSIPAEDPCEMFKRIKFPVEEFFPENVNDLTNCAVSEISRDVE